MNRQQYFNFIEEKLNFLAFRIESRGKLNLLDLNLHSENLYLHFLNLLFEWKLENLNVVDPNTAGIDLVDTTNRIVVQVSATATKQKVDSALTKDLSEYEGYSFKFISISKDATKLKSKTYANPHQLVFNPQTDIFDVPSLLRIVGSLDIDKMKQVYDFMKKEISPESDPEKVELNLATIIDILSKEDWTGRNFDVAKVPFYIEEKITFNELDNAKKLIGEYFVYNSRIDKIYTEFDKMGVNKSLSVLNGIRTIYLTLDSPSTPDQVFFSVIDKVIQKIKESANYDPIKEEELNLCVQILVVDAFIRCEIFENPSKESDARS
ncbi:MAG: SMEK domain-containing protein [Candidatus Aenigmarchaeota archaeon]|nr:SMEK domain-containing protein [Candidatus Aenigmarchaeota archaeon]